MNNKQKLIFFAVVLLAIFFHFYHITKMPGGLFPDMAANGLDINLMQQGHLQPFYERGNGREALFFYMEWASAALFGKGVWQFSAVSALVGVLSVIVTFFLTFRLFMMNENEEDLIAKKRATNIGLLSMFLMAVSSWYTVLSRTAFRANLIPLFSTLMLYFFLRIYQSKTLKARLWFSFLTGASFALGFYTYIAFRIMVPIVFMLVLWPLLASFKGKPFWENTKSLLARYWLAAVLLVLAFVIFIFPIAKYFYTHPGSFIGRSGQVSIFNPELYLVNGQQLHGKPPLSAVVGVLGEVSKTSILGYFTQGDLNWRHNISGYPFLSSLISPFFGVGLLLVSLLGLAYFFTPSKRAKYWKFYFLTGWFWGMLVPVVTTAEGIPHGLRSIGTIPAVFIISAWALYSFGALVYKYHKQIWEKCWCHPKSAWDAAHAEQTVHSSDHPHFDRFKFITWCLKFLVACFFAALILQTYFLYFVYAYNDPANFYYFRSDLTPVSQYLVDHCNSSIEKGTGSTRESTFLVLDGFSVQTTDYLTSNRYGHFDDPCNVPYHQVDPERAFQLPALQPGEQVVFTQSSMFDTKKFKEYHQNAHLVLEYRNKFGQSVLAVYEINK